MELKQRITLQEKILSDLLIVPYGIETYYDFYFVPYRLLLLIVPYGIETTYEVQETKHQNPFNRTLWN